MPAAAWKQKGTPAPLGPKGRAMIAASRAVSSQTGSGRHARPFLPPAALPGYPAGRLRTHEGDDRMDSWPSKKQLG